MRRSAFATGIRGQQLWRLSALDMLTGVAALLLSIASAVIRRSYWGMMVGMLGSQAIRVVLTYTLFRDSRRRLRFNLDRSREVWAFSRNFALSSGLSLFIFQIDKVMLARMLPLASYGFYAIATLTNRRFTRLTNAFSKRLESHNHAMAIDIVNYNFIRIHKTLRVTPAMAAGITDRLWSWQDVIDRTDAAATAPKRPARFRPRSGQAPGAAAP